MSAADLPNFADQTQVWTRWLGYRLPHYDDLARKVQPTLTGTRRAVVRVGFNGTTGTDAQWHITLFTLRNETPDPGHTRAVAEPLTPLGMLLHHVVTSRPSRREQLPEDPRPAAAADLLTHAFAARKKLARAQTDQRVTARTLDRLHRSTRALADEATSAAERAIDDGLRAREGMFLVPTMVMEPAMLTDWIDWHAVRLYRAAAAGIAFDHAFVWRPRGIAVCQSCTTVFVPRRRESATYCRLCSKRPAEPFVLGQRPIGPGQSQTVRVPELAGSMVVGWKTTTVGLCSACGKPYHGRRDATTCSACANRARQQRHRERRKN
ncbi:MAG TPA: hypothetical protein VN238_20490 [Solirubrobacteraceae bacterium]|nr:hypothetical protein [Solirubrobacteraceae bacterium]